jgi:hypothetical protein
MQVVTIANNTIIEITGKGEIQILKKCVLLIATTIFIFSSAIKADTLEEGVAELL